MARDRKVGRAEALRRSMLALIDRGEPHEAHAAYRAPFVVVGQGARASVQALPVTQSEAARNALKGKATPKGSDDWIKRAFGSQQACTARNLIVTIGGVPMPLLDKLRKLAFSDGMRRLAHYTEYFTPLLL